MNTRCVAVIRREFYLKSNLAHDGRETEFIYDDNPISRQIQEANTLAEAIEALGPQDSTVRITEIETRKGVLK